MADTQTRSRPETSWPESTQHSAARVGGCGLVTMSAVLRIANPKNDLEIVVVSELSGPQPQASIKEEKLKVFESQSRFIEKKVHKYDMKIMLQTRTSFMPIVEKYDAKKTSSVKRKQVTLMFTSPL